MGDLPIVSSSRNGETNCKTAGDAHVARVHCAIVSGAPMEEGLANVSSGNLHGVYTRKKAKPSVYRNTRGPNTWLIAVSVGGGRGVPKNNTVGPKSPKYATGNRPKVPRVAPDSKVAHPSKSNSVVRNPAPK